MEISKKKFAGALILLSISWIESPALADEFMDFSSMIGDVNADGAVEMIVPYLKLTDTNSDGYQDQGSINFRILKNNSTTVLYSTTAQTANFPAMTCTNAYNHDSWFAPRFMSYGKWRVVGSNMFMDCYNTNGDQEAVNTFIYVADVTKKDGVTRKLVYTNHELWSAQFYDYDSDGDKDFIFMMQDNRNTSGVYMRTVVKDLTTWSTLSDKSIFISNYKD